MDRMMFLIGVMAVSVLLFATAATAQEHAGGGGTKAQRLIRTGGPPLALPAALVLIGSGAAATAIVRRYVSS